MIRTPVLALARLAAAGLLLLAPGCDTNAEQDEFFLQSEGPPDGITRTDDTGTVLGDPDPDDWRTAPAFRGSVVISQPAGPNPARPADDVSIVVQDTFGDVLTGGVFVSGFDDNGRFVRLDRDEGNGPLYVLVFNPSQLRTISGDDARLYRVRVFTSDSRIISYGDLLVQP